MENLPLFGLSLKPKSYLLLINFAFLMSLMIGLEACQTDLLIPRHYFPVLALLEVTINLTIFTIVFQLTFMIIILYNDDIIRKTINFYLVFNPLQIEFLVFAYSGLFVANFIFTEEYQEKDKTMCYMYLCVVGFIFYLRNWNFYFCEGLRVYIKSIERINS